MATTSNTYTGNGSNKLFSITFPYLDTSDIDVYLNGVLQTITTQYFFANATTVEFVTAPANGATILLDRSTDDAALEATFFPGSSIKASDLNDNFDQVLYIAQETSNKATTATSTAASATTTANTALSQSAAAVSTANTASSNATTAINTASTAVSTANTALSTANTAVSNSTTAISTANSAIAAVASAVIYSPVANLTALAALTPTNGNYFELTNSTGAEGSALIAGVTVGLIGAPGLTFRLRYDAPPGIFTFLGYFANDSETRYLKLQGGTLTGAISVPLGSASAPSIYPGTDTNTGIYSPGADQLAISTNGTGRLFIDSSGRALIGTSSFSGNATQVLQGQSGGATAHAVLWVNRGSSASSGNTIGVVRFADSSAGEYAQISCEADAATGSGDYPGRLVFSTTADGASSPTEWMRITSTGQVRLAGAGITFNGDTATANELDDYEEGTWTPTIIGSTLAGVGTYSVQVGRYTKTGNRVDFTIYVVWSAHTGTGEMRVGTLPFTSSSATNVLHAVSIWQQNITLTASNVMMGYVLGNNTQIALSQTPTGGGAQAAVAMDGSGTVIITGVYEV